MNVADVTRQKFSQYGPFGEPCSMDEIAEAEEKLSLKLPSELRELYLVYNGFRGPTNAGYLFPLLGSDGNSLVSVTQFFWTEWSEPNFSKCLFYGSSSCDHYFIWSPNHSHQILAYHHHMQDEYEVAGTGILDAYLRDEQWFREEVGNTGD